MGQLLHRRTSKNKQEQARTSKQIKHNTWRPTAIDKIARTAKTGHASSSPGADDPEKDTGEVGFGEVILHDQSAKSRESEREM